MATERTMLMSLIEEKMSQERLSLRASALQIGVSHTTLKRILSGENLDTGTLLAVANWLGVSPASALNSLGSGPDALAAQVAILLETRAELRDTFDQIVQLITAGKAPPQFMTELMEFAAFRLRWFEGFTPASGS